MRVLALILCCAAAALPLAARAESPDKSHEEMMKVYEQAAKPGPEHAMLAKTAGTWKCSVKSWMDPAGEPEVSEGSEEAKMIFGGRFLESNFKGTMMGQPFEGHGMMGYDNVKKMYVGTWMDTMGTGIMTYEGTYDPQQKAIVCNGSFSDAATGGEQKCRLVSRIVDDDHHVFEMWGPDQTGKDVKWMEITYTRSK